MTFHANHVTCNQMALEGIHRIASVHAGKRVNILQASP
ncbi:hypothetical protein MetMK1DRAFT_00030830 [Metallosphaera yellowstonensis MK1]|uniref:Uncharacterized protein n=1 Tax=Metallosphaera yellowstonensis MK1 TaxID=671065 RepID=H2C914_9CREN|nr:hypothetical protein MetMK1DRAFT_00030830 [Metallosphaera yellowstonensis MK1]